MADQLSSRCLNRNDNQNMEERQVDDQLEAFKRLPLLVVIDHARAGNNFFKRVFDQHPHIMCSAPVDYLYTVVIKFFGERTTTEGREAYEWAIENSTIKRMVGAPTTEVVEDLLHTGETLGSGVDRAIARDVLGQSLEFHTGETLGSGLDRAIARDVLRQSLERKTRVRRKDVIASVFLALALGTNRDISKFKYLLLDETTHNDLPGGEGLNQRFFAALESDFSRYRVIHLVRDPRANFASMRYQYVSAFGNMYPIRASKIWRTVWCNSIWLWLMKYTNEGARFLESRRKKLRSKLWLRVRIEDVNGRFAETMTSITEWLGVGFYEPWRSRDYFVTSCGLPWRGISAYAPHYNPVQNGPMQNDAPEVWRVCRPDPTLNEKWRKRLLEREIKILEAVNYDELRDLGYPLLHITGPEQRLGAVMLASLPFAGEIPLRREWWMAKRGITKRIVFLAVLPLSYLVSRVMFLQLFLRGKLGTR